MIIKSPMNYPGGKYKLLPQIFEIMPKQVDTFVDLFAGGFNVGINIDARCIICNDQIDYLIDLYEYFRFTPTQSVIASVEARIREFNLSKTNKEGFQALRHRYNKYRNIMDFFTLVCYSFNNQVRFNSNHEYNSSFGKDRSSFNTNIKKNLTAFCDKLHSIPQLRFSNLDFRDVDLTHVPVGEQGLVYCDPPYLISTAAYNDGNRGFRNWTDSEEMQLLNLLDDLDNRGVRFALSNVFEHKGESNNMLIDWSTKYNVYFMDKQYSNCNYQLKTKDNQKTVEVLITNFKG